MLSATKTGTVSSLHSSALTIKYEKQTDFIHCEKQIQQIRKIITLCRLIPESTYQHRLYKSLICVIGTATNQLLHTSVTVAWLIT